MNTLTTRKMTALAYETAERPDMADAIMARYVGLRTDGRTELDAALIVLREIEEYDCNFTGHFVDALYSV